MKKKQANKNQQKILGIQFVVPSQWLGLNQDIEILLLQLKRFWKKYDVKVKYTKTLSYQRYNSHLTFFLNG